MRSTTASLAAALLAVSAARADIINVPGDEPTIQAGVDVAGPGDEVVVAPGEYFENVTLTDKKDVVVRSTDPTDPAVVVSTIINGGAAGSVVVIDGGSPTLSGFVLTNGAGEKGGGVLILGGSPTIESCTLANNTTTGVGGGLANDAGDAVVLDCLFKANDTGVGGAAVYNGSGADSHFERCVFTGHGDDSTWWTVLATITVIDCDFIGNEDTAMATIENSKGTLTRCRFIANSTDGAAGAMTIVRSDLILRECTFVANKAGTVGGAVYARLSDPQFIDCTFIGNSAGTDGGAMYYDNRGAPSLIDCTLECNTAGGIGGGIFSEEQIEITATRTRICGNVPDQVVGPLGDGGGNVISDLYCPPPAPVPPDCPGDFDGNSVVDFDDLVQILDRWGPCPGENP